MIAVETVGERIKKVRKAKSHTQQEFASIMGTTQNSIARYEIGKVAPSAAVIALICRTFNVNENWLRNGEGEMFASEDTSILSQLAAQYGLDDGQLALIKNFLILPDKYRAAIVEIAKHLADEPAPVVEPKPDGISDEEWAILQELRKEKTRNATASRSYA